MNPISYWLLVAIERVVCCCVIAVCMCLGAASRLRNSVRV